MPRWNARVAVMCAAGAIGLGVPAAGLVRALRARPDDATCAADRRLADLQRRVRPGERIAVVLASSADRDAAHATLFRAQYALAPALVEPLWLDDCLSAGPRCRLDRAARVATPVERSDVAAALERRFGLGPPQPLGGVLLLERGRP